MDSLTQPRDKIIWLLVFLMTFPSFILPAYLPSRAYAASQVNVDQAIQTFEAGSKQDAKWMFLEAKTSHPDDSAVNYYLGIIYLEEGDKQAAVDEWRQYVEKDPYGENATKIRKNLTILQKQIAKEYAREMVANESVLSGLSPEPNSLAVLYFKNLGSAELDPIQKGMTAMLITDLSQVDGLKIVERVRLQSLIDEMQLGAAGYVDDAAAPRIGRLLKAEKIVNGNYADESMKSLNIQSLVTETDGNQEVGSALAKGMVDEFWKLEKTLANHILIILGYGKEEIPAAVQKIHTKNYKAFEYYCVGLDYLDKEDLPKARDSFNNALKEDPGFDLAETMLIATPIAILAISVMISNASSAGIASSAAAAGAGGGKALAIGAVVVGAGAAGYYAYDQLDLNADDDSSDYSFVHCAYNYPEKSCNIVQNEGYAEARFIPGYGSGICPSDTTNSQDYGYDGSWDGGRVGACVCSR
jgi:Tfp pilus assembly protein PilF